MIKNVMNYLGMLIELWIVVRHIYGLDSFIYRKGSQIENEHFFHKLYHVKISLWILLFGYLLVAVIFPEEKEEKIPLLLVFFSGFLFCMAEEKRFQKSFWIWPTMCTAAVPSIISSSILKGIETVKISQISHIKPYEDGISKVMEIIILIAIVCLDRKYAFSKRVKRNEKFLVAVVSVLIAVSWIMIFEEQVLIEKMGNSYGNLIALYIFVAVILIWATIRNIYVGTSADYYKQLSDINEKYAKESLQYYESYKDAQIETRKLRHDMKNHLACMQILMQEGKVEELQKYLESFHTALNEVSMEIQTQNDIVDAILNLKCKTAKKEEISISVNGVLPNMPWIEAMDWCKIFSNAIDNGIEAIRKCQNTKKTLQISINNNQNFLVLHFENPCNTKVKIIKNQIKTDKAEQEQHGFGLKNIESAVKKYNGEMQMKCMKEGEQYRFLLDLLLPLQFVTETKQLVTKTSDNQKNVLYSPCGKENLETKNNVTKLQEMEKNEKMENQNETSEWGQLRKTEQPKRLDVSKKKEIKRHMNHVARGIIWYTIISFGVVFADMIIKMIRITLQTPNENEQNRLFDMMCQEYEKYGTSMIIAVLLGAAFLFWFFRKEQSVQTLFTEKKKMSNMAFFQILCVFMGGQLVFGLGGNVLEIGFNLIGYTAAESLETASASSETLSMFLYACLVAPVIEELVYRGFVLRSLQRYGKWFAIVVSSVLFGVMHANLPQGIFAFYVGLILAYVAMEYSIKWSILLHVLNNGVFGDLFNKVIQNFPEQVQNILQWGVMGVFFILGLVIIWKKQKQLKEYILKNRTEKKMYLYAFTSIWMVVFIICELALAIGDLQRI